MQYRDIVLQRNGSTAIIILNRPEKLNAYRTRTIKEIGHAIKKIDNDDNIKVIIISGAGRAFCSGHDIQEIKEIMAKKLRASHVDIRITEYPALVLAETDKPIIAAINGVATGGGLALALMCDIRIASEESILMENHIHSVGSVPALETWLLPRLVGLENALRLIFTGQRVSATEAKQMGLISEVVSKERLMERAIELAEQIANGPLLALRLSKKAVYEGLQLNLVNAMNYVALARAICTQAAPLFRAKRTSEKSP